MSTPNRYECVVVALQVPARNLHLMSRRVANELMDCVNGLTRCTSMGEGLWLASLEKMARAHDVSSSATWLHTQQGSR